MSQSHDGIEEVTCKLEETEKDLEIKAEIGKKLLEENQQPKKHIEELKNDVRETNEYCSLRFSLLRNEGTELAREMTENK